MAIKSLRRKSNKRSSNLSNPMAPSPASFRSNPRTVHLLISAVLFGCVLILLSIASNMRTALGSVPNMDRIYSVEVVREFPHDPNAFTQPRCLSAYYCNKTPLLSGGLLYAGNDTLFESTGLNGRSSVRKVALETGKVEAIHKMQNSYFGEGLTLFGDRLFQVNWMTKTGFIYDRNNLSKIRTFTNRMQDGWGLTANEKLLFGSDGTSTMYQIDPNTLKVVEKHTVRYKGHEVHNLNELEYVNGEVWANVWQTNCIARISGKDGTVLGWIYLPNLRQGLIASGNTGIDVLNGIAWDQERNRLFVTGKLWPKLFEIKLHPMKNPFKGDDIERICMPPPVHFGRT